MNLYLISQSVNNDYDTYDSAVVAAESVAQARKMYPGSVDGAPCTYPQHGWASPKDVTVKLVGVAHKSISKKSVICSSYNAG